MAGDKAGRVIFIGNIPYGLTETQIIDIFSNVGKVLSFRLVHDKDTGRPKGFGFAEFQSADEAASAVRNLNDHDIMGRRLRVDYSNDSDKQQDAPAAPQVGGQVSQQPQFNVSANGMPMQNPSSLLPALPPGSDPPAGLSIPDAISKTLSTLQPPQLLDIISQMKGLVTTDPSKATELLDRAPQLSYAIFQALLTLGLVDVSVLKNVVDSAGAGVAAQPQSHQPPQPIFPIQPPHHQQQPPPQQQPTPQFQQQMPGHMAFPPPQFASQQQPMAMPTPPQPFNPYGPPPGMPQQQQQQQQPGSDMSALHQQVLSLTQDQLNALPPGDRAQLLAIRQQLLQGRMM